MKIKITLLFLPEKHDTCKTCIYLVILQQNRIVLLKIKVRYAQRKISKITLSILFGTQKGVKTTSFFVQFAN